MRRSISLFTLLVLILSILAACGDSGTGTNPTAATGGGATATTGGAATATTGGISEPTETAGTEVEATATTEGAAVAPTATTGGEAAAPTATEAPAVLGSGGEKITIWHGWQGEYLTAIQAAFAKYATDNNVTIELLRVPDLNEKVAVAVPSGQGPDIIAWVNDQIGNNVLSGIIQPLDDYGVDQAYLGANFTEVAARAMTYDDMVYGIPESMEALTFIYNKKLVTETDLPKTTDDLLAMSESYNAPPDKYFFVYNGKNDAYFSAPWWQGAGVTLVSPEGTTELGNEESVAAGELIAKFSNIMPKEMDYGVADTLFKEGKAAIIMNGPWSIADYQKAGIDVGLATIPTISSSGQPGKPFVGVKMLMLSAEAKNPQAAVDLMKYYGSTEVQTELAKVNKQVPANSAAQDAMKSDPIIAGFIKQAANGEPMPNTEFISAMWDPIARTVESIWTGATPPAEAVKQGQELFDEKAQDLK
jgi:maltose-binding protein MalE